jgi:hypothetical protein
VAATNLITPTLYQELLEESRRIMAEGVPLTPAELSRRTGRGRQSCKRVLEQGWKDRLGQPYPWAPAIRQVLETERRTAARGQQLHPAAISAANGDPALAVAQQQVRARLGADPDSLTLAELLHTTGRASLTLALKLGRSCIMLVDSVETEIARQLVSGEIKVPDAFKLLHRSSEVLRNTGALAKAVLDAELALLAADPAARDTETMDDAEAEAALDRVEEVLRKRKARKHLTPVPDDTTDDQALDGHDDPGEE